MYNIKELLEDMGIKPFRAGQKHGGEYHSACPSCGDHGHRPRAKGPSDRFQVWPDRRPGGYYTCRKCGLHGDNIQFVIDFQHKTFHEACQILGISKQLERRRGRPTPAPVAAVADTFLAQEQHLPPAAWMDKAKEFAEWCHLQLLSSTEGQAMLQARGLTMATAQRYLLGYNPGENGGDLRRARKAWGLADIKRDDGKLKALWLPRGLVMPTLDREGRVVQLRIRRRDEDIARFCSGIKYQFVEGGAHATLILEPEAKAFVLVESGLDAFLVAQDGAGLVGAVSTWTAKAGPDAPTTAVLDAALRILVALDADEAGAAGSKKWLATFRQARRWPVPKAKDPGDAKKAGVDLRLWIIAGLPPALTIGDHGVSRCAENQGGAERKEVPGETVVSAEEAAQPVGEAASNHVEKQQTPEPGVIHGVTADGRQYTVVETKEQWEAAVARGELVFSRGEVERMQAAFQAAGLAGADAIAASATLMDIKEVFEGSYITYGGEAKEVLG